MNLEYHFQSVELVLRTPSKIDFIQFKVRVATPHWTCQK